MPGVEINVELNEEQFRVLQLIGNLECGSCAEDMAYFILEGELERLVKDRGYISFDSFIKDYSNEMTMDEVVREIQKINDNNKIHNPKNAVSK
ncbi:MAG: hypothetical protein IJ228_12030 [Succinivibrio sp.]|nr:hypothetical protein [Succinivibrio sp.]